MQYIVKNILIMLLLTISNSSFSQQYLNLGFEQLSSEGVGRPWGWQIHTYAPAVRSVCDTRVAGNNSLQIHGKTPGDTSLFEITFAIDPSELLDQTVALSGRSRTADFSGVAGIRMETIGKQGEEFAVLAKQETIVQNSEKWTLYSVPSLMLNSSPHTLNITLFFRGSGTIWWDDLELRVGSKVLKAVPVASPFTAVERRRLVARTQSFRTPVPARHEAFTTADFSDLQYFGELVGDASIIALGEATHGTAEFFQLKHRLLQYAVRELGVRVFILEDNQLFVERINKYVLNGTGSAREAMRGLFKVWNTESMLKMIEWVRAYNLDHADAPVEFVGMDVQNPSLALQHLDSFLIAKSPILQRQVESLLQNFVAEWRNSYLKPEAELSAWQQATETVYELVNNNHSVWLEAAGSSADSTRVQWALQNANLLRQTVASMLSGVFEGRDRGMAENVEWIRAQRPSGTRVLIWAHDTHVARGEAEVAEHNYYYGQSLGAILAKRHGENYRSFGLSTYTGTCLGTISYTNHAQQPFSLYTSPEGSLDAELHQLSREMKMPNLLVDLRVTAGSTSWLVRPIPVRYVGYVAEDYGFYGRYVIPQQFDGIFFIDQTTAAVPLKDKI